MISAKSIKNIVFTRRLHSPSTQDDILPFEAIPTLTLSDVLTFINPYSRKTLKQKFEYNYAKYGNIYKMQTPGAKWHQVWICDPSDGQELLRKDGPMPHISGFDFFVAYRNKVAG